MDAANRRTVRSIDEAGVVCHVYVGVICVHVLGSVDCDASKDGPGNEAAPPPGTPKLEVSGAVDGRKQ